MAKKMKQVKPLRDPTKITAVIFRKYVVSFGNGEFGVVALFPEIPTDCNGRFCQSYEHLGQHSSASYNHVVSKLTVRAKAKEYAELKTELESIGYKLKVFQKRTPEIIRNFSKAVDALNT